MVMATSDDQVLNLEKKNEKNSMASRKRYKIGCLFHQSRHNRVHDRV
jgi:hypothetical protein